MARWFVALMLLAAVFLAGYGLIHSGLYGLSLFVLGPFAVGGIGAWAIDARTGGKAAGAGALATAIVLCSLLPLKMEGAVCIVMALPLALPLGAFGGWIAYRMTSHVSAPNAAMLLLLPLGSLSWDVKAPPPVYEVRSAIEIAATPEVVWKHVVTFSEIPEPREWYFHTGLAYPIRARIEGTGPGAVRYCEFSTGPFVEPIVVWDEPRLLSFRVTQNPAPMHEWSPYAHIEPNHLHGYLVSEHGQFRLTELPNHHTLLEGTTWYRHGLWPAQYWRWWSDAIIHRIHMRVLTQIRSLAEANAL